VFIDGQNTAISVISHAAMTYTTSSTRWSLSDLWLIGMWSDGKAVMAVMTRGQAVRLLPRAHLHFAS
jgi:hypothetical protein